MIWEKIRGHRDIVERFRRSLARGRLAHAYLFVGPAGVGRKLFARALAQCLFCERFDDLELESCGECPSCRQMLAGSHPDFLSVGCPEGKRVLPIDLFAGAPDRRGREGLCFEISLRPAAGNRRIALIDDAELMNAESANALLKTLEEPPPYATIILISSGLEAVLPTIRSRCQLVRFGPLPEEDVAELLLETELVDSPAEAAAIAPLSEGSMDTAGQLLDPQLRQLRETIYDALCSENFNSADLVTTLQEGLDELAGDSQAQRAAAVWLVRFAVEFYRRVLRRLSAGRPSSVPQVERRARQLSPDRPEDLETLAALIDRGIEAETQLDRAAPVPLCLESLFADLSRISRSVQPAA